MCQAHCPQLPGRVRVDKGGSDFEVLTPLRCPSSFTGYSMGPHIFPDFG